MSTTADKFRFDLLSPAVQEMLKFAPEYGLNDALRAIEQSIALQRGGLLRPGVYYLVLTDLVGSTSFMADHGNEAATARIATFIGEAITALTSSEMKDVSLFLKEIGDAVLLVFRHFPDVLRWHQDFLDRLAEQTGQAIQARTLAHVGEVSFSGVNPLALAVSQLFKMEKHFGPGNIGMNETTFAVAAPAVDQLQLRFTETKRVRLPGYPRPVSLYTLDSGEVSPEAAREWVENNGLALEHARPSVIESVRIDAYEEPPLETEQ